MVNIFNFVSSFRPYLLSIFYLTPTPLLEERGYFYLVLSPFSFRRRGLGG